MCHNAILYLSYRELNSLFCYHLLSVNTSKLPDESLHILSRCVTMKWSPHSFREGNSSMIFFLHNQVSKIIVVSLVSLLLV